MSPKDITEKVELSKSQGIYKCFNAIALFKDCIITCIMLVNVLRLRLALPFY